MDPVIIVGAGLAGLSCARALKRRQIPFLIIEASDRLGGKLKTDVIRGFHLDRGFQVYFTAYPTAKNQLDENKLDFKRFDAGAVVIWDGTQQMISRDKPLQTALSSLIGMSDKLRLGRWTSDLGWLDQEDIQASHDTTSEQLLKDEGFSDDFIERFARPFLGGVFADRSLTTSSRQLQFVWKALGEGETVIPELGMEEIPKQIGATFGPDLLWTNIKVVELLRMGSQVIGVKLDNGQELKASHVVLATDVQEAANLSGLAIDLEFRHSISIYFTAPTAPIDGPTLVLNGNMRGITNSIAPISAVKGHTSGEALICATILGERPESDEQLAEIVKSEMLLWFPDKDTDSWSFLKAYRCPNAQLAQPPHIWDKMPRQDSGIDGLIFAGEYTTNSSIDGAIRSGLEAADLILENRSASVA